MEKIEKNLKDNNSEELMDIYDKKAQCQEWGYKNPLTRLVALFS